MPDHVIVGVLSYGFFFIFKNKIIDFYIIFSYKPIVKVASLYLILGNCKDEIENENELIL